MGQLGLGMGQGFREGEFVAIGGGGAALDRNVPTDVTNTLVAYDPNTVVAAGGLLTSWDDKVSSYDINTTDPDFGVGPTQPTVDDADDDFGTAIILDSGNDHRASGSVDLSSIGAAADDSYWWFVLKTTRTDTPSVIIAKAIEAGNNANFTQHLMLNSTGIKMQFQDTTFVGPTSVVGLNDGVPHLFEFKIDRTADTATIVVDGATGQAIAIDNVADFLSGCKATSYIHIGKTRSAGSDAAFPLSLGMFMIDSSLPDAARITEVREWARDNMGCVNIA